MRPATKFCGYTARFGHGPSAGLLIERRRVRVIVITGSRLFPWRRAYQISQVMDGFDWLIVGDCPPTKDKKGIRRPGADHVATQTAKRRGMKPEIFYAEWHTYGKFAGPMRNEEMAIAARARMSMGQEVICHAFPIGESPGTRGCIKLMAEYGIPVIIHEQRGPDDAA